MSFFLVANGAPVRYRDGVGGESIEVGDEPVEFFHLTRDQIALDERGGWIRGFESFEAAEDYAASRRAAGQTHAQRQARNLAQSEVDDRARGQARAALSEAQRRANAETRSFYRKSVMDHLALIQRELRERETDPAVAGV